jgi:hypothetical protein
LKFYSWKNYEVDTDDEDYYMNEYDNSRLTGFSWDTEDDDYDLDE